MLSLVTISCIHVPHGLRAPYILLSKNTQDTAYCHCSRPLQKGRRAEGQEGSAGLVHTLLSFPEITSNENFVSILLSLPISFSNLLSCMVALTSVNLWPKNVNFSNVMRAIDSKAHKVLEDPCCQEWIINSSHI